MRPRVAAAGSGRPLTRALLQLSSVSVLENTTFGSALMGSPVGLIEAGHVCAMSDPPRRPSARIPAPSIEHPRDVVADLCARDLEVDARHPSRPNIAKELAVEAGGTVWQGRELDRSDVVPRGIVHQSVQHSQTLDRTFFALSDPTRRSILERLARGPATIGELAVPFGLTLNGLKKHVGILETVDLVITKKVGRARECRLGPAHLEDATSWIDGYRRVWERRLDRFGAYVEER